MPIANLVRREDLNVAEGMAETPFQSLVMRTARDHGWRVMHISDSRRQAGDGLVGDAEASGWPDLVLVRGSQLLAWELKSGRGRVRPEQRVWLDALDGAGVAVAVKRPRDWPEMERVLTAPAQPGRVPNWEG